MQNNTILQADVLDIIFEGRNKEYGAYQLRRTYNRRMTVSIAVMMAMVLLFFVTQLIGRNNKEKEKTLLTIRDADFKFIELPDDDPPPPPPPATPPPPPPATRSIIFTPPQIVQDDLVNPDEQPPPNTELENVRIDVVANDGTDDVGIVAPPTPPSDGQRGILQAPRLKENPDSLYISVQIESSYPGGPAAWQRFLKRNLHYPQSAAEQEIQGDVMVQFIVDKEGNVSDVQAISGPEALRSEAERVIRKSGKWNPAVQNGMHVKSYKRQPIGFRLLTE